MSENYISPSTQIELQKEQRKRKLLQLKLERKELLNNNNLDNDDIIKKRKKQQQTDALRAAESITESLQRTKTLLERELERSGKTLEKLTESNKVIADTLDEQHLYKHETHGAKSVRKNMKTRENMDVFVIIGCIILYIFIILLILYLRISFVFSWIFFWV